MLHWTTMLLMQRVFHQKYVMKGRESATKKPEKHHSLWWAVWCKTVSHGDICSVSSLPGSLGTSVERGWNFLMKDFYMTYKGRKIFPYSKQENNHLTFVSQWIILELMMESWKQTKTKIHNNISISVPIVHFQKQHSPNFYGSMKYENIKMELSTNPGIKKRTHTSQCLTYLSILVVLFQYLVFHYLNGTKYSLIFIESNSILAFAEVSTMYQYLIFGCARGQAFDLWS